MKKKLLLIIFILLLIAAGAGGTYFFYTKYQSAQSKISNPEITAQEEVSRIVGKIGQFLELPSDEQPTVATVLDKDKLKDQPFFAKAENGDKVVIYSKAMKAILYRESANKIIEVAPIQITQPPEASASPEASATPTPEPTPEETPAETPAPPQE
jgi:hypothetical protein